MNFIIWKLKCLASPPVWINVSQIPLWWCDQALTRGASLKLNFLLVNLQRILKLKLMLRHEESLFSFVCMSSEKKKTRFYFEFVALSYQNWLQRWCDSLHATRTRILIYRLYDMKTLHAWVKSLFLLHKKEALTVLSGAVRSDERCVLKLMVDSPLSIPPCGQCWRTWVARAARWAAVSLSSGAS